MFDISTGISTRFADGYGPSLAVETGTILVRDRSGFLLLDSSANVQARVVAAEVGFRGDIVSPAGDMILAEIPKRELFYPSDRLVLFHKDKPDIRYILDNNFSYRVDWTTKDTGISNQAVQ